MITFQEETLNQKLIEEADYILKLHSEELTEFSFSLNPDWDLYRQFASNNMLHVVTARNDEKLIGYHVAFLIVHHHYKNMIVAENDLHYILPEYRKGWLGYRFLKRTIQFLKKHNVNIITHSMKASKSYLPLAERLGFKLMDYRLFMEV